MVPILCGLVFWFCEATFDALFGAVLGWVNMKFSLGPVFMTFSLAVYSARYTEMKNAELLQVKDENRRIYNSLIYDRLSTLYSRQYFVENLEQRMALNRRKALSDCLMFMDVDHFKAVNDELGHLYGDKLIAHLGGRLKENSRKSDTCARYGGDEFLILLENCRPEDAVKVGEQIQAIFGQGLCELLDQWKGWEQLSLSIGIVHSEFWGENAQETIQKADLAMYQAKRRGKNRVVCYSQIPGQDQADG